MKHIGSYAFLGGLLVTLLLAFTNVLGATGVIFAALLGLAAGFMNITKSESVGFLVATIALGVASGSLAVIPAIGSMLTSALGALTAFFVVMAIPVALTAAWRYGQRT